MRKVLLFLLLVLIGLETRGECPIVPVPKYYHSAGMEIALPKQGYIVIAPDAEETIVYAAERFQTVFARITGRNYDVVREIPHNAKLIFLFGIPENDPRVAKFCHSRKVDFSSESWGNDGFLISFDPQASIPTVCVAAGIPRGVIYGQEALCALAVQKEKQWMLQVAEVRDYSDLKWRSFSTNRNRNYLRSGVLDAYADARINCIELRDGVKETMYGQFGFPVQYEITGVEESKVIKEAHKRGIFVWGVVSCGVKAEDEPKVLAHFRKLIALGVDGLYISYDDPRNFTDGVNLIKNIFNLAKENNYGYDRIAYLPPSPDYNWFYSDFNKKLLQAIPELKEVLWFLTATPSLEQQELLQEMGLKRKHGWFFNWPMGGKPAWREPGNKHPYHPIPDFSDSYDATVFSQLQTAECLDSIMVWVRNYPEQLAQLVSCYAWAPRNFDFRKVCRRIHTRMFGAELTDDAWKFDQHMFFVKRMLSFIGPWDWQQHCWRINDRRVRPHGRKLIAEMRKIQKKIAAQAPQNTWLDPQWMRQNYIEPMAETTDLLEKLLETDFPEHICPNFDRDLDWETNHKKTGEVYLKWWKPKIEPLLKDIERKFGDMQHTRNYVKQWRDKLKVENLPYKRQMPLEQRDPGAY